MRPKLAQAPGYIDEPIAMVRSWGTTSDTLWYLQGNNYNVEALTDRTGAIVERYAYTPYGEATVYTAPGTDGKWFTADDVTASVSAKGNALTFQGRELDAETGVYYFRYRYYAPSIGKFLSRDPKGFLAGDINLNRFIFNQPFQNLDPNGLTVLRHGKSVKDLYNEPWYPSADMPNTECKCAGDPGQGWEKLSHQSTRKYIQYKMLMIRDENGKTWRWILDGIADNFEPSGVELFLKESIGLWKVSYQLIEIYEYTTTSLWWCPSTREKVLLKRTNNGLIERGYGSEG